MAENVKSENMHMQIKLLFALLRSIKQMEREKGWKIMLIDSKLK